MGKLYSKFSFGGEGGIFGRIYGSKFSFTVRPEYDF